jgi:hypothetical protein
MTTSHEALCGLATSNFAGRIADMEEIVRKGWFCTGDHIIVPNLGNGRLIGGGAYDKM